MGPCSRKYVRSKAGSPYPFSRSVALPFLPCRIESPPGDHRRGRTVHTPRLSLPGLVSRRIFTDRPWHLGLTIDSVIITITWDAHNQPNESTFVSSLGAGIIPGLRKRRPLQVQSTQYVCRLVVQSHADHSVRIKSPPHPDLV